VGKIWLIFAMKYYSAVNEVSCKALKRHGSWAWWCVPGIPALRKQRQEDLMFKASLNCIARPPSQNEDKKTLTTKRKGHENYLKC
jgi:hypothetical protein